MITVIPTSERKLYSYDQIKQLYDGKWIFLTNVEFSKGLRILKGTPVVLADRAFEEHAGGIYDELENGEHGKTATTDLTNMAAHINVASILWGEDA